MYEVVTNPDGKVAMLFDGAPVLGCFDDIDCPGPNGQCYLNQKWAAYPAMCGCDSARTGDGCGDLTSAGMAAAVISGCVLVASALAFLVACRDCIRLVSRDWETIRAKKSLGVLPVTLIFAALALFFIMLYSAYQLMVWVEPYTSTRVILGRVVRAHPYWGLSYVSVVAFYFMTLSNLNLTLTFVAISKDFERLRHSKNLILRYRRFLFLYYLVISIMCIYFIVIEKVVMVLYVAFPAAVIVWTFCMYAYVQVKNMQLRLSRPVSATAVGDDREGPASNTNTQTNPAQSAAAANTSRVLDNMRRTSLVLAVTLWGLFSCEIASATTNERRAMTTTYTLSFATLWIFACISQVIVVVFVHYAIVYKPASMSSSQRSGNKTASSASKKDPQQQQQQQTRFPSLVSNSKSAQQERYSSSNNTDGAAPVAYQSQLAVSTVDDVGGQT